MRIVSLLIVVVVFWFMLSYFRDSVQSVTNDEGKTRNISDSVESDVHKALSDHQKKLDEALEQSN